MKALFDKIVSKLSRIENDIERLKTVEMGGGFFINQAALWQYDTDNISSHQLSALTTGDYNSAFGVGAGTALTSGYSNTFIGNKAGDSNTSGYNNVFVGQTAGDANTSGRDNICIGAYSGLKNTIGYGNTFIGFQAGYWANPSINNTFIGRYAGLFTTTGGANTFVGAVAGQENTEGYDNAFFGSYAGYLNTTGYENTFIGASAGYSTVNGLDNVYIGYQAGYNETYGVENVYIGYQAGYTSDGAEENVFIGSYAGYSNTTGYENVFIGRVAGFANTTGGSNVFIGDNAGRYATSGFANVFIGDSAGYKVTEGDNNVIIGWEAGHELTTGYKNVFIGWKAGYNETGSNKLYIENSDSATPLILGDFDADTLHINGSFSVTPVWKSWDVRPDAVKAPGTNPPAEDVIDNFSFYRFDRGTEESLFYIWEVPADYYASDGSVKGRYEFVVENPPTSGGTNVAENVRMGFEYKKISDGEVFSFTSGTSSGYIDETIAVDETAWIIHQTSEGTCVTTGWAAGDTILFRFYRDATAAEDTYDNEASAADNDVWVFDLHMNYLTDRIGEDA